MNLAIPFRPKFFETLKQYSSEQFRRDFAAGVNVMIMAFPLSVAFAIASGAKPEQGLLTSIIGGGLIAAFSGSRVQIGGPTGAFVVITYSIIQRFGTDGLLLCTALAGVMLCVMGFARIGAVIRFIPYPVSRAFTKGIAILILSSQIKSFLGLNVEKLPVDFVGKVKVLVTSWNTIHPPTVILALTSLFIIGLWPKKLSRLVPGSMVGLLLATVAVATFGLADKFHIATIGSQFGGIARSLPALHLPVVNFELLPDMIQPAFTIAMLVAMQALLCGVVTDGMLDERHDSNQELVGQGIANFVGPLFGCIPVTGAVARSVVNVRSGARTPVAGIVHSVLLLLLLLAAAPLLSHIPLATLSAVLVVAAYRMVSWKQFLRLARWPFSDSSVFLATFALTVLTNLTLAVEVGVVLAALLMVKRISETSQITAVDESTETEGSHHSLVGREIPPGVLVFRVFGAFFFGVVDKLDDELKRAKREPEILILRVRKVLAIDATGLQALEDLHVKLRAKGKHLILSAPHTQPLMVMEKAGFLDRVGRENVCPHIAASLARAREILGLPPEIDVDPLQHEREKLEAARRELTGALERANEALQSPAGGSRALSPNVTATTLPGGGRKANL
ncbi:MAG TPA: SulP family inorganic anion transporter, partial [Candidatus Paceibacterota bacterium]|nr:SulP family inorganic anion transporter [Candidatus Paceibacterota bacterium]